MPAGADGPFGMNDFARFCYETDGEFAMLDKFMELIDKDDGHCYKVYGNDTAGGDFGKGQKKSPAMEAGLCYAIIFICR